MGHGTRPDLSMFSFLLQVPFGNIFPSIFAKANCYRVIKTNFAHELDQAVMGLNLSGVRVKFKIQFFLNKFLARGPPVYIWI
jgi:hypothetical protein